MVIEFYTIDLSPFGRGVWMTLEALGLEYEKKITSPLTGESKTDAFTAINPAQKIPAITDGSVKLGESKAIACYLCNVYGDQAGKSQLYPKDPKKRARVDMVLSISDSTTSKILISYLNVPGVIRDNGKTRTEEISKVHEALGLIERLLSESEYVAADHLTIADFFVYIGESMLALVDFNDYSQYPKVAAWKAKMAKLSYHKMTCEEPVSAFTAFYKSKLQ